MTGSGPKSLHGANFFSAELSTNVRCHFWCSPGCSTCRPRPEKSSSSSCWMWDHRLGLNAAAAAPPAPVTSPAAGKKPPGRPVRRASPEQRRLLGGRQPRRRRGSTGGDLWEDSETSGSMRSENHSASAFHDRQTF